MFSGQTKFVYMHIGEMKSKQSQWACQVTVNTSRVTVSPLMTSDLFSTPCPIWMFFIPSIICVCRAEIQEDRLR